MKILLVSPDNVPNIALMKISAWHKNKGDAIMPLNFFLGKGLADKIYVSCIFPKNMKKVPTLPEDKTTYGGVGYDFIQKNGNLVKMRHTWLEDEIEFIKPNYFLYNLKYSMGFTSRGCIRNCPFCVVQQHEGALKPTNDIYTFFEPKFDTIRILDNNLTAIPEHFDKIASQIIKEDKFVVFDGVDARVLTDRTAYLMSKLKTTGERFKFALDQHKDIDKVMAGVELLKKHGVLHKTLWYCLLDAGETIEQEMERIKALMKYNLSIYPMFFNSNWVKTDNLLQHYPIKLVINFRCDNRIFRRFHRYLAYKLGFYDKYRLEMDEDSLKKFQDVVYNELGWINGKFPGKDTSKEE